MARSKKLTSQQIFFIKRNWLVIFGMWGLCILEADASEIKYQTQIKSSKHHSQTAPATKANKKHVRSPLSMHPLDTSTGTSFKISNWYEKIFRPDRSGILNDMRVQVNHWEDQEVYYRNWNLEDTGFYQEVDNGDKLHYLKGKYLKYIDQRFDEYLQDSKEEDTIASKKAGTIQRTIKPNGTVSVSKNVRFKFKAKALQGKANMELENPYVKWFTHYDVRKGVRINLSRDIDALDINTGVDYFSKEGSWQASVDKQITEKIKGRISSKQTVEEQAFSKESDKKIEVLFNSPF